MTLSIQETIIEADRCVACGLCLPHCPTYHKTGSEADSPRGRLQLMSAVAKEILPNNARFKQHIDLCLGCRNCESACPNGVRYGALIDSVRATVPTPSNVGTSVMAWLTTKRKVFNLVSDGLRLSQKIGVLKPLSQLHPSLKRAVNKLPLLTPSQSWKAHYPSQNKVGDVSLFLGCISNAFDAETLRAAIFALNNLGYDVHIPDTQTCCGGLARQQGDALGSAALLQTNQAAFNATHPVLTVASGCGAGLKDYTTLAIQDISDFLLACDWSAITLQPLCKTIAVHDPCTLRNVQKSHASVHALLKKIPEATITPLKGNAQCCGGAGAYMLNQRAMAEALLSDKVQSIAAGQYAMLATSNIGCAMHIGAGINAQAVPTQVMHPITILAKQMGFNGKLD